MGGRLKYFISRLLIASAVRLNVLAIIVSWDIHAHFADELFGAVLSRFLNTWAVSMPASPLMTTRPRPRGKAIAIARPLTGHFISCGFAIRLRFRHIIDEEDLGTLRVGTSPVVGGGAGSRWRLAER